MYKHGPSAVSSFFSLHPLLSSWLTVSFLTWRERKNLCVRVYLPVLQDCIISAAYIWAVEGGNIASAHERNVDDERPKAATVWKGHASRVDALQFQVLSQAGGCCASTWDYLLVCVSVYFSCCDSLGCIEAYMESSASLRMTWYIYKQMHWRMTTCCICGFLF